MQALKSPVRYRNAGRGNDYQFINEYFLICCDLYSCGRHADLVVATLEVEDAGYGTCAGSFLWNHISIIDSRLRSSLQHAPMMLFFRKESPAVSFASKCQKACIYSTDNSTSMGAVQIWSLQHW